MAGKIRGHDVRAWIGALALFEQIGQSLVHQRLYLPAFLLRQNCIDYLDCIFSLS